MGLAGAGVSVGVAARILSALRDRASWFVAGTGVGVAALVHSGSLALATAAAAVGLFAWNSGQVAPGVLRRPQLPSRVALEDPVAVAAVDAMRLARGTLAATTNRRDARRLARLCRALRSVSELEERALGIVARVDELGRYVATADVDGVRRQVARTRDAAASAPVGPLRDAHRRCQGVHEEHLRSLELLQQTRLVLVAELDRIVAALQAVPARLVALRTLENVARDASLTPQTDEGLDGVLREIEGILAAPDEALA